MKNLILLFLCLFGLGIDANSQSTTSQISGTLADSLSKKPIHSARISLKNNSKVEIKSTISSVDGFFEIKGVAAGQYLLTINSVGYQAKTISLTINTSSKNLAIIPLSTSTTQLKGIEISGERPLIKQEIDRISYDVKNDPESKVNSVLEMMRKVPLLSLDADDNIQLQGNSNYKILINGRPSGMMERNPKDILKSMPSSTIERIEVITTPPAKYDGEGLAGIINIITFKKQVNGSNGSINANHRFPVGGPGMGGSLTIKAGKLGISTNAGGSLNSTPQLNNSNLRYTDGSNPTRLAQFGTRNF
ncbi:MAG: carboxypeptidase regulatory-like domain-containing protein, partial [Bacteroidia bacterium]